MATFETITVRSAAEMLHVCTVLKTGDHFYGDMWFRGVKSEEHALVPSLYRSKNKLLREREGDLINEFFLYSKPLLKTVPANGYEWCSLMQHHGLPTRLLDWSQSCLIALYFALAYWNEEEVTVPCVWVLDGEELNKESAGEACGIIPTTDRCYPWLHKELHIDLPKRRIKNLKSGGAKAGKLPIAIYLSHANERVTAQRGAFTLHGSDDRCLTDVAADFRLKKLKKIRVTGIKRNKDRDQILRELYLAGITQFTIFPDLDGLAKSIVWTIDSKTN
jgi:hypothetical protein